VWYALIAYVLIGMVITQWAWFEKWFQPVLGVLLWPLLLYTLWRK